MENWLDSDDIDLQTTGVLALGNFARTDSHCIEMVDGNITAKLLGNFDNIYEHKFTIKKKMNFFSSIFFQKFYLKIMASTMKCVYNMHY